jgi:hypothetical protein
MGIFTNWAFSQIGHLQQIWASSTNGQISLNGFKMGIFTIWACFIKWAFSQFEHLQQMGNFHNLSIFNQMGNFHNLSIFIKWAIFTN